MKNRIRVAAPLLLLLVLLGSACAGNINPDRQIDDAILATNVRNALAGDEDLRRYDIVVNAQDSMVTLLGAVETQEEKAKAGMIAERVDGVTRVSNELRVD